MTEATRKRIRNHNLILALYRHSQRLADFYDSFGNEQRAEEIREVGREFSRLKLSTAILETDLPEIY
jgi:hypothetical protein